jgi:hypothetical protein
MPSTWQLTVVLAVFFGIAGFIWLMRRHFARRWGVSDARIRWVSLGFVLFGAAFAAVSAEVVRTRLAPVILEARLPGTPGLLEGDPAVVRTARFEVSRPGQVLRASVRVVPERGVAVRGAIRLRVSVFDPDGSALVDTVLNLPARALRSIASRGGQWEKGVVDFRPSSAGRHVMRLIPLHPRIARLELKVTEVGSPK